MPDKKKKIHLVCNAHLDPAWLWTWEEGMAEAAATFRVAADFCDTYPEFVFNHNESLLYRWVERNDPRLCKRIQGCVKRGQWHTAGGAFVQPDLNVPSGETHIRNYLLGLSFFKEKFGTRPRVAYNFDPFGQPEGFSQILAGCGMTGYIFCRPDRNQWPLPFGAFLWRDRSGVGLVARRSEDWYLTNNQLIESFEKAVEHYAPERETMLLWGLGNHGGGVSREQYALLEAFARSRPDLELIHSTPERFFGTLPESSRLPVVTGEMQNCFRGCYTSMSRVKVALRRTENMMATAERLSALTWWLGLADYPGEKLARAWRDILFCTFHDVVPGSGIPSVEHEAVRMMHHAREILDRVTRHTLTRVVRDEPRAEEGKTPVFVFNPHGFSVKRQVEFEFHLDYQPPAYGTAVPTLTRDGRRVPNQRVRAAAACAGDWRARLVAAIDLEPFQVVRLDAGYRRRSRAELPEPARVPTGRKLDLLTRTRTVTINLQTGLVDAIRPRRGGASWVRRNAFRPILVADLDHSWDCRTPGRETGSFRLATATEVRALTADPRGSKAGNVGAIRIVEEGKIRTVLEVLFVSERSSIVRHYIIGHRDDFIQVRDQVFYTHKDTMLKLDVPLGFAAEDSVSETPYSAVVRAPERQMMDEPNQRWVAARGAGRFLALLNDGSYAHNSMKRRLLVNLLRSPGYASFGHLDGDPRQVGRSLPRQDQGEHVFTFEVVCGRTFDEGKISRCAAVLNGPPATQVCSPGGDVDGRCAMRDPSLTCNAENVLIEAVKRAEKGRALAIRLREVRGRRTRVTLDLCGEKVRTTVGPYELKTLRVSRSRQGLKTTETSLVEGL